MARLSPFVPLAQFWPFRPGYGLSGLCFSDTLYNLTICEKRCHLCSSIEMSIWFTREFAETVLFNRVGRSTLSDWLTISRMFISQITYSEDNIYKRRNCNLKLKSSFTKLKRIIPEKITITIQYRHKKRFTANCQDHREMKSLLLVKQKLKYRLQRTRQSARNKESRTLVLEAIGKLCRHGRIILERKKLICNSQSMD